MGDSKVKDKQYSAKMNYFLNQFYMRLTAQTYCKMRGLSPTSVLDEQTKSGILNYIGE